MEVDLLIVHARPFELWGLLFFVKTRFKVCMTIAALPMPSGAPPVRR
jgi:hypothetical protein